MDPGWIQAIIAGGAVLFTIGGAWTAIVLSTRQLKKRVELLEQLIERQEAAESVRQTHYDDIDSELESQIDGLQRRLEASISQVEELGRELKSVRGSLSTTVESSTAAHRRIDSLESHCRNLQEELAATKRDLAVLTDGVATRLEYLAKAETMVSELSINGRTLQSNLERAEKDIQRQSQSIESLMVKVTKLETKIG